MKSRGASKRKRIGQQPIRANCISMVRTPICGGSFLVFVICGMGASARAESAESRPATSASVFDSSSKVMGLARALGATDFRDTLELPQHRQITIPLDGPIMEGTNRPAEIVPTSATPRKRCLGSAVSIVSGAVVGAVAGWYAPEWLFHEKGSPVPESKLAEGFGRAACGGIGGMCGLAGGLVIALLYFPC